MYGDIPWTHTICAQCTLVVGAEVEKHFRGAHQLVASLGGHDLDVCAQLCQRCNWWPRLVRVRCSNGVGRLHKHHRTCGLLHSFSHKW